MFKSKTERQRRSGQRASPTHELSALPRRSGYIAQRSACSFTIANTGARSGTAIPQVYIHFPVRAGEPPSVLRGFTDVDMQPGEARSVTITLSRYDLSIWDVVSQSWITPCGVVFALGRREQQGTSGWRERFPL